MVLPNGKRYFRLLGNQAVDIKTMGDILYFLAKNY